MTPCSKPSCPRPAAVTLSYDYGARIAVLEDGARVESTTHLYRLCSPCADKLRPPHGWDLLDDRNPPSMWPTAVADVGLRLGVGWDAGRRTGHR